MWDTSIITDAGVKLLQGWVTGRTLVIDGARAGSGAVPQEALKGSTALLEEKQILSIAGWTELDSGARCEIVIEGPEKGYVCNQIGLWAHLDGGESVLIALYQDERGIDVPAKNDMPEFRYTFYALIALAGTGELSVNVDPTLTVSMEALQKRLAEHNADPAAHGRTDITGAVITLSAQSHVYDMQEKTQSVESVKLGDETLAEGVDYIVVGNRALSPGSYHLTVLGIGSYTGAVSKEWMIADDPAVARKVTVSAEDLTDGESPLQDGEVVLVYE